MKKIGAGWWASLFIVVLLAIDQWVKIYIKTHFTIGESVDVFGWFKILFVENNGMAFGIEVISKLFLSLFRLIACGFIGYYLYTLVKKRSNLGYILCIAAIWAGAFGNIIDSIFYGVFFSESTYYQVAEFLPTGGGYAGWFHGKVVDMLYFPIIETRLPYWLPIWGGDEFVFFRPVFNIADSAITCGVIYLLLFERKHLMKE